MDGHGQGGGESLDLDVLGYDGLVPEGMTSFVGRDEEVEAARALLLGEKKRLVTLLGIGGVGKSRLLEHLAGELSATEAYPDGVILVRLDDVPPSADVIASTIALRAHVAGLDNASESALARLITHFQNRRALLLLDNCEQLVVDEGPLARLLNLLLRATRALSVVATSQVKLGAVGERLLNVPPLGTEDALEVLLDRAAAVGQPIMPEEYPLARRLCEATDGIPLAIELAAGRLDVQTLQELVERAEAEDLLPALVDGTAEQRYHRTMAGSIARSYELLNDTEQRVFALLSVFRGSFDLAAAAAVVSAFDVDPDGVAPMIVLLARRSLLVAENHDGRKRFRMVEVIRQFAQQQAHAGAIDVDVLHEAHSRYFLDFAARARREWFGPREPVWMRAINIDVPNFRMSQQRLLANPDTAPLGLELALNVKATRALVFSGRLNEGRRMLESGLAAHPPEPSLAQVAALSLTLWVAVLQGQKELADSLLQQTKTAATQLGCWESFGPVLYARGTRLGLGAPNAAQAREALDLLSRAESAFGAEGVFGGADFGAEFMAALFGAIVMAFVGDRDAAFAQSTRVLAVAKAARSKWCISWGLWVLALTELMHGDNAGAATRRAQEALAIQLEIGDRWGPTWALWLLALCAINDGDYKLGAQLLGGADREQVNTQTSVTGLLTFLRAQQKFGAIARKELGDSAFEELVAAGFTMDPAQSFALALPKDSRNCAPVDTEQDRPRAAALERVLSEREIEVANLVAQGKTNGEIAVALFLSERTVEGHIGKINTKLGTRNRTEITAYVMKHLLGKSA